MEVPRYWRTQKTRYALVGNTCRNCQARYLPPRELCPRCGGQDLPSQTFCGRGEVFSFTTVYHPPDGYAEFSPYTVALVKLEEGPLIAAQLADVAWADVEIGMQVEMVTRKLRSDGERGIIVYGYKFRPLLRRAQLDTLPGE